MADVRIRQRRARPRLALEACFQIRVGRKMLRKNFDSDIAPQACIPCPIDLAHPACAQRRVNLIGAEFCSHREGHDWPPLYVRFWIRGYEAALPVARFSFSEGI